jgi:hypothetical protein
MPTMVILKARLLAWCVEPWCHVKAAVPVRTYHCQHLFIAAGHCVLIPKVSHDEHGVEVEHLQHQQQAPHRATEAAAGCCQQQEYEQRTCL